MSPEDPERGPADLVDRGQIAPGSPGPADHDQPPRRPGRTAAVSLLTVVALVILGAPLGLLWRMVAPSVPVQQTTDGAILTQPQPEEFIAADGWFSMVGFGFGVLAAIGVWLVLRRHRGPLGMLVVVVGTIGAAVVAWQLGRRVGLAGYEHLLRTAPEGKIFNKPPDLRAGGFTWYKGVVPILRGTLLLPAFGAAMAYTLLAGWSHSPSLRPERAPQPQPQQDPQPVVAGPPPGPSVPDAEPGVSSGSAAHQSPPATPAPPEPDAAAPPRD